MENFRLKVFRIVAEQMSFRKASEALHLSQPAVSQHVHALEEELSVRLFDRGGNRVALTPAGALLLKYARKAAVSADQALAALAKLEGETSGELHLGASTTVAQYVLPRMLGAFLKDNPRVGLSVISGNTERVVGWVQDRTISLGLIEGPARSKGIHAEKFLDDRMVLIAPPGHEWSEAGLIPVEALLDMPLLLREQGSGSRRVVELALKRRGLRLDKLRVPMQLDSTEAIVSGVEAALGVGFVSEWAIGKELRLGTVSLVRVKGLEVRREFSLVRMVGPVPEGPAGAFLRFALAQRSAPAADK